MPSLPAGAAGLNALYRRVGATAWLIASQVSAAGNVSVDDLSSGVAYEFAAQAYSFSGALSPVSAVLARTALASGQPAAPTGLSLSIAAADVRLIPPAYAGAGGAKFGAGLLKWTASSSADVAYYNIRRDAGIPVVLGRTKGTETTFTLYAAIQINPLVDDIGVQAVSRSGVASAWTSIFAPHFFTADYGTADMAEQLHSAVEVSSIFTGADSASSGRPVLARYPLNTVVVAVGGAASESFQIDLTGRGFGGKPDVMLGGFSDLISGYEVHYDWSASTSTSAKIWIVRTDGTVIGASSAFRLLLEFVEY